MYISERQLKECVLDAGLVSRADFERVYAGAQEGDGYTLGAALVEGGSLSDNDLRRVYASILGIPFVTLDGATIQKETLALIPEPIARMHNLVAYRQHDNTLEVALLNTDDLSAIDFLKKKNRVKILPRFTDTESIKSALKHYQHYLKDVFGEQIRQEISVLKDVGFFEEEQNQNDIVEHLSVVRIVDALLRHAIAQGVSHIHIEPVDTALVVRYRIDGVLHDAMTLPKESARALTLRFKHIINAPLSKVDVPHEGRFKMQAGDEQVSFRISTMPTYCGEKIALRLIRENGAGFTLEGLGFHGASLENLHDALSSKNGLALVAGPKQSGKTTAIYTILDTLNIPECAIATIEDPIEFRLPRVTQTQVKETVGLSLSAGLRALMHQDPDVIMVSEVRNRDEILLAFNAAALGRFVITSYTAPSAADALVSLCEQGIPPSLIVSTLRVVVGSALVHRLSTSKEKKELTRSDIEALSEVADLSLVLRTLKEEGIVSPDATWETIPLYSARPTGEFENGFDGVVGVYSVLPLSPLVKECVLSGSDASEIDKAAHTNGILSLTEEVLVKAVQGHTTLEEVLRIAQHA